MSKTNELLRQMIENPSEEMLRPARKTLLVPQPDGSLVRRVTDKEGNVTEDTISAQQRLLIEYGQTVLVLAAGGEVWRDRRRAWQWTG